MAPTPVKTDNELKWNGRQRPFHELYSLKLHGSNGKFTLLTRYGLITPFNGGTSGVAVIEAVYAERGTAPVRLVRHFDLSLHDIMHAGEFIRIGNSRLSVAECIGEITAGNNLIKWDLIFEDPVQSLQPYPRLAALLPPLRRVKHQAPRLSGFVTGTVYAGHKTWHVRREKVCQDHAHSSVASGTWTRASCLNFREDASAWLSAVSLPWARLQRDIAIYCVGLDGVKYLANTLPKILWGNRSRRNDGVWEADFCAGGLKFACCISFDPASAIEHPDYFAGKTTAMADVAILVSRRQRGVWREFRRLSAAGAGVVETIKL